MTANEMGAIMGEISLAYSHFGQNLTDGQKRQAVNLWAGIFAEDDAKHVAAAVREYIANDQKGYAPWPGAIKTIVRRLAEPKKRFVKTGEDDAGCHTGYWVTEP